MGYATDIYNTLNEEQKELVESLIWITKKNSEVASKRAYIFAYEEDDRVKIRLKGEADLMKLLFLAMEAIADDEEVDFEDVILDVRHLHYEAEKARGNLDNDEEEEE